MKLNLRFISLGLILAGSISGQSGSSSDKKVMLSGKVYDPNGAVVMGSDVLARSRDGQDYHGRTNSEGIYKIELPMGIYKIEANAEGFCPRRVQIAFVQPAVPPKQRISGRKQVEEQKTVDFVLEVPSPVSRETIGPSQCKQRTMTKKDPPKRRPDVFRGIAD
jgi:hypothetical protein